ATCDVAHYISIYLYLTLLRLLHREVFKAKHRQTGKKVALKKVLMENEKEGFPITALREIKILQLLKHENVVNLIEICRTKGSTSLVSA
ncbi:hypothetical protein FKM82_029230, partial [Ascaphus truei]